MEKMPTVVPFLLKAAVYEDQKKNPLDPDE